MGLITASGKKGVVASGHKETSNAAARILEEGGNAFDAVMAGMCAATVAEPMLVSLGGGGFLVAKPKTETPRVYDFFCQTPLEPRPEDEIDFYPFIADFGWTQQEFHIGMGAIAVPGVVAGLFAVHRDLGRLPIKEIVRPAVELAREGVRVNEFQAEVLHVLRPIYDATREAHQLYASPDDESALLKAGEIQKFAKLADTLEWLAEDGEVVFYRGDLAQQLVRDCAELGGQLTLKDLDSYRVERRRPVDFSYHGAQIAINSPPSLGGGLIAFALNLLENSRFRESTVDWGSETHLSDLLRAMHGANSIRREFSLDKGCTDQRMEEFLDPEVIARWRAIPVGQLFSRGTTHISVADREGDLASMTTSNGEGCGYVLPGTDIMLNNMLGEEDLNPQGFYNWKPGMRMASMMSPVVAHLPDGSYVALGSGGSNRIRSAVTQVLINLVDFQMSLSDAIQAPRMHLEKARLSMESGFSEEVVTALESVVDEVEPWGGQNLFFGGVHAVRWSPDRTLSGYGDARRSGHVAFA
ncbi:MAG TPA: gamma-glutamyltransferase [Xanthomonadales bacterium]|nr:gamma-glutamyltransferase [Xanthomonadales bacterium]